ncbi:MAG TPA: DUF433 domain-containing protein [Phenylobacterium sp.]|jgi:uncharacterized protein (DUF433 family)|uniref:DUF433 domain-containing protein n=1 Tax=Phenylobacterium sp. TaxID=1871053 RepID=UPI002D5E9AAB|nr:DUF433 domain-containing protein [Phenylobacterium sp.]HZZ67286.1 DUF433 domain-containing protein [Phenylobacterium sp.]
MTGRPARGPDRLIAPQLVAATTLWYPSAMVHDRIEIKPDVMGGKPVIKGTRITVEHVLRECAVGMTPEQVVEEYPHLTTADVLAALAYAADYLREHPVIAAE